MADTPKPVLTFADPGSLTGCFGCAERRIDIPGQLPDPGDDFDWRVRDYDGFRQFMLEELSARFPERTRWTPADLEVVIVEVLAAMLDRQSDAADRIFSEGFLETARRPDSLRRLLSLIGYDAVAEADALGQIDIDQATSANVANSLLDTFWARNPHIMNEARKAGPRSIRTQHRMVSVSDYAERLEDHPLVLRAQIWTDWSGSWETIFVAVIAWDTGLLLDDPVPLAEGDPDMPQFKRREKLRADIELFNERRRIAVPVWDRDPTIRTVLRPYVDQYRMAGQEVILRDAVPVGITIIVAIVVNPNYFRSEVSTAAAAALGRGEGGFFEPGRLKFGEDLFASDVIAELMRLDGIDNVCLIRFKRSGNDHPDQTGNGRIRLDGLELAICDNDADRLERGYLTIKTNGGLAG